MRPRLWVVCLAVPMLAQAQAQAQPAPAVAAGDRCLWVTRTVEPIASVRPASVLLLASLPDGRPGAWVVTAFDPLAARLVPQSDLIGCLK